METDNSEWFKENEKYFTLRVIEEEIGCPKTTLQKWIKGNRVLAERWRIALNDFIFQLTGMNKFTEASVITEVRERYLKDPDPSIEIRKTLVEPIVKKEKVKILKEFVEKLTEGPKEEILVDKPIEMGFDMMYDFKPAKEELVGMKRKKDNIDYNNKWYNSYVMIKKEDRFVRIDRYSKTIEEAERMVKELKVIEK
jgi:hypothetical protein